MKVIFHIMSPIVPLDVCSNVISSIMIYLKNANIMSYDYIII